MHRNKKLFIVILFIFKIGLSELLLSAETIIKSEQLEMLPHGRTTGSILENWITEAVFFQVESGGLSRVDPIRFSARGISWIEQNFRVNGIDVTDPFRSGYPMFEPAWESINGFRLRSAQENDPYKIGIDWITRFPDTNYPYQISYNNIFPAGNSSYIPEETLDREPSYSYGSPKDRRRYRTSNEVNASYNIADNFFVGNEFLITQREFPTLVDKYGNRVFEKAEKYTLTSGYNNDNSNFPYSFLLISQYNHNDNYGANFRLDNTDTINQQNFVNHLQFNTQKHLYEGEMRFLSGFTVGSEKLETHLDKPRVVEFGTESGHVPDAGVINRINFDNSLAYKYDFLNIETGFQINAVYYKPDIPYLQTMQSLDGNVFSVTLWDDPRTCREYIYNGRLKTEAEKQWGFFSISGNVYIDNTRAVANGENLLNWYGLGGRIKPGFEIKKTNTNFVISVLHQPSKINSYIVGFLNNKRPSGTTYGNWIDSNNNGIAEDNEIAGATLMSTTGGKYRYKDKNLKRPYHDEVSAGIEQGIGEYLTISVQGSHRIFSGYFIVNYEDYNGTYTTTPEGHEIYNKPPGIDGYYLSNFSGDRTHSSGAEIQLLWEWGKIYLNFMFSAFMVKGFAPIGNGPDHNDYAVISEDTASPNSRINSTDGRLSSDRAYMANLLFAYKIRKDLTFGITIKYRDGEPFSQYRIYTDSNGMPVKIMDQTRGNWFDEGTGRYTFAWNMDIRLRYKPDVRNKNIEITLDIYNLLGSATEILESNKLDDDRMALEAVPQRMINCGLQVSF